uniref:HNH endonuclease n=1 Tax=Marseillevirus LCMAC101 TaxID=2506602 RepID=A0A481YRC4_9VIRU|nr:MAG: HNH endonuclease [Marseillevirus LCMAC101]
MSRREVVQLSLDGQEVAKFSSHKEACEKTGIGHISLCCNGSRKTAGGYKWKHGNEIPYKEIYKHLFDEGGKILDEYPGYIIFNDGRVFSIHRDIYLKPGTCRGYQRSGLSTGNNVIKNLCFHILVAKAFLSPIEGKTKVNHKDGNKSNNHVDNLEWVTTQENNQHAHDTGLTKSHIRAVNQYSKDDEYIQTFSSVNKAAKQLNVRVSVIPLACRGRNKTCRGYILKYVVEKEKREDDDSELWKTIPHHLKYEVSTKGRIYSNKSNRIMKLTPDGNYLAIRLEDSNYQVHTFVVKAFLDLSPDIKFPRVNHKDGNGKNNHLSNLEWLSARDNTLHAYKTGLNKNTRRVQQSNLDGTIIKTFNTLKDAAEEVSVTPGAIVANCKGKTKLCQGYKFSYIV